MGQRGPWRSPEPQGALSVSEGLGGHPRVKVSETWRAGSEVRSNMGCDTGFDTLLAQHTALLSQSWPLRHVFPLNLGTVLWLFGRGVGGTSRLGRVGPSRTLVFPYRLQFYPSRTDS